MYTMRSMLKSIEVGDVPDHMHDFTLSAIPALSVGHLHLHRLSKIASHVQAPGCCDHCTCSF